MSTAMTAPEAKITTRHGKKFATLPVEDYEALRQAYEDLHDIKALDAVRAQIAAGTMETYPADLVRKLIEAETTGETIAIWCKYRKKTQKQLAEEAGITPAFLSEIIHGKKDGSIDTLKAIASSLDVSLDDLV